VSLLLFNPKNVAMKRENLLTCQGNRLLGLLIFLFFIISISGCRKVDADASKVSTAQSDDLKLSRDLDLELVANQFVSPIGLVPSPDDSKRLFVVDQVGKIWIIDKDGNTMPQPFIDVSSKLVELMPFYDERGLLGLAFHPQFKMNGKFYLFYTAPPPPGGPTEQTGNTGLPMTWDNMTTISEFHVSAGNMNMADVNSERIILEEPHPQFNHNGGTIEFGSDGYLYISIGDGGNKNDIGPGHVEDWYAPNAGGNGQDIEKNLMGNILRIDVNSSANGKNYAIPSDNPFVGKTGLDEIYAYGFRNPYRFSFDMSGSRRLFAGDAGQNLYEEISIVDKGGNYGWNVKEATHCFNAADEFTELPNCVDFDVFGNRLIDPVIELKNHEHPDGGQTIAIIGGNVYRGNDIPGLNGKYIFGSLSADEEEAEGEVFVARPSGPGLWMSEKLSFKTFPDNLGQYVKGFGQDMDGEVYVLATEEIGPMGNTGKVYKIVGEKKHGNDSDKNK
jgi:glucose/arabinose dehydrogenase